MNMVLAATRERSAVLLLPADVFTGVRCWVLAWMAC
jgi:hypothetical protein